MFLDTYTVKFIGKKQLYLKIDLLDICHSQSQWIKR